MNVLGFVLWGVQRNEGDCSERQSTRHSQPFFYSVIPSLFKAFGRVILFIIVFLIIDLVRGILISFFGKGFQPFTLFLGNRREKT